MRGGPVLGHRATLELRRAASVWNGYVIGHVQARGDEVDDEVVSSTWCFIHLVIVNGKRGGGRGGDEGEEFLMINEWPNGLMLVG